MARAVPGWSLSGPRSLVLRRFWGKGGNEKDSSDGEGALQKIGQGFKSLFGGGKDDRSGLAKPMGSGPLSSAGLGLAGALLRPMLGMVGSMFEAAQGDLGAVTEAATAAILRSGRLGSRVECGQVFSQSYSSININGQQSTQVQLQFQVLGESGAGMASCSASVGPGGVDFQDLRLDGSPIDTSSGTPGPGAAGVIDV